MPYKETVELEQNIKIKNRANKIYSDFLQNIQLKPNEYQGSGKFKIWSDAHSAKYVIVHDSYFEYVCSFLLENYSIVVTPDKIFDAIKANYRGVEHLEVDSKGM
jgi:hypothetical protein